VKEARHSDAIDMKWPEEQITGQEAGDRVPEEEEEGTRVTADVYAIGFLLGVVKMSWNLVEAVVPQSSTL
jgi:hypothetical protein